MRAQPPFCFPEGYPLWDVAPPNPLPVLRWPSASDETLPLGKHSCHGIRFMLLFVRSYNMHILSLTPSELGYEL
jgi:hypothetical protein